MNRIFPLIDDSDTSRNDVVFRKHSVQKHCLYLCDSILHQNFQRLRLVLSRIDRREPRKSIFAFCDPMALIPQIAAVSTIAVFDRKSRTPEIPRPACRELLRQSVHGVGSILVGVIRIGGKSSVVVGQKIVHSAVNRLSVIQVKQKSVCVYLKLICCMVCL